MSIFQTLCYVEIETVSACTRSCPWCLFGAYPDFRSAQEQYLDTEVIYNVFRSLKRNGFRGMIALFSINEPLLDERIRGGRLISDCKRIFDGQVLVGLTTTKDPAPVVYSDYKGRWSIETYNNYVKNDAGFNDLKFQGYYEQHGFDFIMLVTGILHEKLNASVKLINKSSISIFDVLIKAGHMRMVKREDCWQLHNTRTKDLALLEAMGFVPDESYPL